MTQIAPQPDWHSAAQSLINHFAELPERDDRVALLESICDRLGGDLYPAFLQLLYTIERYADKSCKQSVVDTVSYGLSTGRLPSGKLPAWGSNSTQTSTYGQIRNLGPIEFLCAWYSQSTHLAPLSHEHFSTLCASFVRLFSLDQNAAEKYMQKISADISDPLVGALSNQSREGLKALVSAWHDGKSAEEIANLCLQSCELPRLRPEQLGGSRLGSDIPFGNL